MWKRRPHLILLCLLFLQLASSISPTFCPHIFSELNTFSVFVSHLCDRLPSKYLSFHLLSSFHHYQGFSDAVIHHIITYHLQHNLTKSSVSPHVTHLHFSSVQNCLIYFLICLICFFPIYSILASLSAFTTGSLAICF